MTGKHPRDLRRVTFLERREDRARRRREALRELLGPDTVEAVHDTPMRSRLDSVGYDSASRPHAFVALPFADSFIDIFYGIAPPIRAAG